MTPLDPVRLLQAARTSIALITLVHETIWSLFPDELIALTEYPEKEFLRFLAKALHHESSTKQ
jgi:hypothetical protein